MTAREQILKDIQRALGDVPTSERPEDVPVARAYWRSSGGPRETLVEQFIERVGEYKARVQRVSPSGLPSAIHAALAARGVRRLIVPRDLELDWPSRAELAQVDRELINEQLDTSDGVLTTCALGIAQTGTIVLDGGPGQGRRALTLLPDYHLCVVREQQIVGTVPEAVERLRSRASAPLTWISGPSATSDIELNRVEGVHGPRTLEVLVVAS